MTCDAIDVPLCSDTDDGTIKRRKRWRQKKRKRPLKVPKVSCFGTIQAFFKKSGDGCANLCFGSCIPVCSSTRSRSPDFQRHRRSWSDDTQSVASDKPTSSEEASAAARESPYSRQRNASEVTNAYDLADAYQKIRGKEGEEDKSLVNNLQKNANHARDRRRKRDASIDSPAPASDEEEMTRKGSFLNSVRRRSKDRIVPNEATYATIKQSPQVAKKTEDTIFGASSNVLSRDDNKIRAEEEEFKGRRRASSLHKLMGSPYSSPGSPVLHRLAEETTVTRPNNLPLQQRQRSRTEGSNRFPGIQKSSSMDSASPSTPDKHSSGFSDNDSLPSSDNLAGKVGPPEPPPQADKPLSTPRQVVPDQRGRSEAISLSSVDSFGTPNAGTPVLGEFNLVEEYDKIAQQVSETDQPAEAELKLRVVSEDCSTVSVDSGFRNSLEVPSNTSSRMRGSWSDFENSEDEDTLPGTPTKRQDTPRVPSPSASMKETTEVKLHNIARELLSTEESYVAVLKLIDQVFHKQIREASVNKHIIPEIVVNNIFCHVPAIYQFHSSFLLPQLQARLQTWETNARIGDIMTKAAPFLKMYSLYVQNFDDAMSAIKTWTDKSSAFASIIKDIQKLPECNFLTLQHHMLSPVQRVPRYRLLLDDYVKRLPEDSEDKIEAEQALKLITVAATHSNETMKKIDKFRKLVGVANRCIFPDAKFDIFDVSRELWKEGKITKISARNGEKYERYLFLLSDMLLYGTPLSRLQGKDFRINAMIHLETMNVTDVKNPTVPNAFCVHGREKSMEFASNTADEKDTWVQAISDAIAERLDRLRTFDLKRASTKGEHGSPDDLLSPMNGQIEGSPMHVMSPQYSKPFTDISDAELGNRAPRWIKDHEVTMCMSCSKPFNKILRRRHHCRACGKVVCSECSEHKATLHYDPGKPLKVCFDCYNTLNGRHQNDSTDGDKKGVLEVEADAVSENSVIADYLFFTENEKKKTWVKTWCVIPNNELCLYFYGAHQDVRAQMTMPLPGFEVSDMELKTNEHKYCFKLRQARKVFLFASDNRDCVERWKYALQQASIGEDLTRDEVYRLGKPAEKPPSSSDSSEEEDANKNNGLSVYEEIDDFTSDDNITESDEAETA